METEQLKTFAGDRGATLTRVADLDRLRGIETTPPDLLDGFTRAVSMAVALSDSVIETIDRLPTPIYAAHYARVNALLDEVALQVSRRIESAGFRAMPLPASQVLDVTRNVSYLSHKAVAVAAGIGWQGKSLLTVSPQFGPRIRLVTVLTDAPLPPDEPLKNRCGSCSKCAEACPAGAIRNVNTDSHYSSRHEALHFERCVHHVREVCARMENIGASICGVCIRVCPWGGKRRKGVA